MLFNIVWGLQKCIQLVCQTSLRMKIIWQEMQLDGKILTRFFFGAYSSEFSLVQDDLHFQKDFASYFISALSILNLKTFFAHFSRQCIKFAKIISKNQQEWILNFCFWKFFGSGLILSFCYLLFFHNRSLKMRLLKIILIDKISLIF